MSMFRKRQRMTRGRLKVYKSSTFGYWEPEGHNFLKVPDRCNQYTKHSMALPAQSLFGYRMNQWRWFTDDFTDWYLVDINCFRKLLKINRYQENYSIIPILNSNIIFLRLTKNVFKHFYYLNSSTSMAINQYLF